MRMGIEIGIDAEGGGHAGAAAGLDRTQQRKKAAAVSLQPRQCAAFASPGEGLYREREV